MKKSDLFELRKRVGDFNAILGAKDYVFNDGPARGVRAFDLKNGAGIELTVLADRGLDIPYLTYKGVNMAFASKTSVRSPHFYQEDGARGFLKQFNAGMLTTCGITYAGAAGEDNGRALGLHGPYSNLPASNVSAETAFDGDEVVIKLRGDVREACVFEENMLLSREITLKTESNELLICDTVENQGYEPQPLMLVYHINFGYPMLDAGAKIYTSAKSISARTDFAEEEIDKFDEMIAPEVGRDEQCYFHTDHAYADAFCMLVNEKLGLAAIVKYDAQSFPIFCEWKCMRAGDYALGLEPTTSGVSNRAEAKANGTLKTLGAGESVALKVALEFTDDESVIAAYKARAIR